MQRHFPVWRVPKGGRVYVQTRQPDHHALVFAAGHDTEGFLARERTDRMSPSYPPVTSLVNLVASGEVAEAVAARAGELAAWCEALVRRSAPDVLVLGPAPCPVSRIKGRTRWHVVLKGPGRDLGRLVRYAATRLVPAGGVRVAIDRDPVSLL